MKFRARCLHSSDPSKGIHLSDGKCSSLENVVVVSADRDDTFRRREHCGNSHTVLHTILAGLSCINGGEIHMLRLFLVEEFDSACLACRCSHLHLILSRFIFRNHDCKVPFVGIQHFGFFTADKDHIVLRLFTEITSENFHDGAGISAFRVHAHKAEFRHIGDVFIFLAGTCKCYKCHCR